MLLFSSCDVIGVLSVVGKRRESATFCPEELLVLCMYILNIYVKTKQYVFASVTDLSVASVHAEPLGILLKCSSWFSQVSVGPESLPFLQAPG